MKLIATGKIGGYAVRMHGPDATGQFVNVAGKRVYFDFDEMFGPLVVDPLGEPMKRQPIREDHPFWAPFNRWLAGYYEAKQAQRLGAYLDAHTGTAQRVEPRHGNAQRKASQDLGEPREGALQRRTNPNTSKDFPHDR